MLFFRSEDLLNRWCAERGVPRGPIVAMGQLWRLAWHWYADRLSPAARRPGPAEMRRIFASLGLTDPFWDPDAVAR
ncbi:MAG TPA: hypothetical protein VK922_01625 [Gemmatimonadaceae bacterium]|nr:hypothetical protein [Gemmatimonadaceae bacterium]